MSPGKNWIISAKNEIKNVKKSAFVTDTQRGVAIIIVDFKGKHYPPTGTASPGLDISSISFSTKSINSLM